MSYVLFAALGQLVGTPNYDKPARHPTISINFVPITNADKYRQTNKSPQLPIEQATLSHTKHLGKVDEYRHDEKPQSIPTDTPAPAPDNRSDKPKQPINEIAPTVVSPKTEPISVAKHTPANNKSQAALGLHPIFKIKPVYPMFAIARGIEGWVKIELTIAENGTVIASEVVASEPPEVFDQTTLVAVSQWRYPPGDKNKSSVLIKFELR